MTIVESKISVPGGFGVQAAVREVASMLVEQLF